jgi:hypothetical protein
MKDTKKVRQFLADALLEGYGICYQFEKLYESIVSHKFKEVFPDFYIQVEGNEWRSDRTGFEVPIDTDFDDIIHAFNKFLQSNNVDELKIKEAFGFLKSEALWLVGTSELKQSFRYGINCIGSLFYVLRYVCNDSIDKDLREAHDLMDKNNITNSKDSFKEYIKEFGVEITSLKNGKIKLKGLSKEQEEKLAYVFGLFN